MNATIPTPIATTALTAIDRHNFRHLYHDIGWWGLFVGSTLAFIVVYATRLGATTFEVGLFSSGVAVISLLVSIPAGHWLEGRPLLPAVATLAICHRIWFAFLIPLPWVFAGAGHQQVAGLLGIYFLAAFFGITLAIGFNAAFAEVVPHDWRKVVVGRRMAIHAIVICLSSLTSGQLLDRIQFPLNYQLVFTIGAIGALMSCYHLTQLKSPTESPARLGQPINDFAHFRASLFGMPQRLGFGLRFLTRSSGKPLLRWDLVRGPFGAFLAVYLVLHFALFFSIPLYPILAVRELKLSDSVISIGPILTYSMVSLISLLAGRYNRIDDRKLMIISAVMYGLQPLCLMLARGADSFYWLGALAVGGGAALLGIALTSRLMARAPADDRPAHMALYNLAIYIGVLLGSLIGPWVSEWIGVRPALGLAGIMTLLCIGLIRRWG